MPGQSSVEVEAEIFDFIGLRKLNIIDFNWWAGRTPCSVFYFFIENVNR
jgi:hypothetical protein